jgi:aspartyl-tRNA(Asn)/glutamyl-tRNA(Gln) amidotransferase subunit A
MTALGLKSPWRIGVPKEYNIQEMDGPVRRTWRRTIEKLRNSGHHIQEVSLPSTAQALSAYYILAPAEASSNLAKYDGVRYGARPDASDTEGGVLYSNTRGLGLGNEVKRRILLGSYSLSASAIDNYFLKAQLVRRLVQRDFDAVFASSNPLQEVDPKDQGVDILLSPTAPTLPPSVKMVQHQTSIESYMNDVFTVPASLAGLPAISVPVSLAEEDQSKIKGITSAGMQLIGQYGHDSSVLEVASLLEDTSMYQ